MDTTLHTLLCFVSCIAKPCALPDLTRSPVTLERLPVKLQYKKDSSLFGSLNFIECPLKIHPRVSLIPKESKQRQKTKVWAKMNDINMH